MALQRKLPGIQENLKQIQYFDQKNKTKTVQNINKDTITTSKTF